MGINDKTRIPFSFKSMTVKSLRAAIEGLPDDTEIRIAEGITGSVGNTVKMHSIAHKCDTRTGELYSIAKDSVPEIAVPVFAMWT